MSRLPSTLPPSLIIEVLRGMLPPGYVIATEAELTRATGEDLLTEEEVAAELHVAVATLRKWRTTGEGPVFIKVPGFRAPQYRRRDLEAWKADLPGHRSTVDYRLTKT